MRRSAETARTGLARFQIEGLRSLFTGADFEFDFFAVAQVLEVRLRRHARTMKEHVVATVVGDDEAEPLVANDFLDGPVHVYSLPRARLRLLCVTGRFADVTSTRREQPALRLVAADGAGVASYPRTVVRRPADRSDGAGGGATADAA